MNSTKILFSLLFVLNLSFAKAQAFSIKCESGDILYSDFQNSVEISVPGYEQSEIFVYLKDKKFHTTANRYYLGVMNGAVGDEIKLKVVRSINGVEIILGEQSFYIAKRNLFSVYYGQYTGVDSLTIANFLESDSLLVLLDFSHLPENYKVISFSCLTVPKNALVEVFTGIGNKIPQAMMESVKKLNPGDKVLIDQILVMDHAGETKRAAPLVLIVK